MTVTGNGRSWHDHQPAKTRRDGLNFGHLFTDKANRPCSIRCLLTIQRPLDPKATDYDFGFKVQGMYGSDARYTHYLGELDYIINDWSQITPVEAWGIVHTPWLFSGGIDIKAGQCVTLEGAETIDPTTNYLYSHSYIFNFGIPLVQTGIMTISHVDPMVDIYLGVTTGVNTTFGNRQGDNNGAPAFMAGIGLNLLGRQLSRSWRPPTSGRKIPTPRAVAFACACNPNNALALSQRHHGHLEGHRLSHLHHRCQLHPRRWRSTRAAMASRNTASTRSTIGCSLSGAPRFGATTTTSSSRLSPAISISSMSSIGFPNTSCLRPRADDLSGADGRPQHHGADSRRHALAEDA